MANGNLSETERNNITDMIRGLRQCHQDAGISRQTLLVCDACRKAKHLLGAVTYDSYRVCNDCALFFELARREGEIGSIADLVRPRRICHARPQRRAFAGLFNHRERSEKETK